MANNRLTVGCYRADSRCFSQRAVRHHGPCPSRSARGRAFETKAAAPAAGRSPRTWRRRPAPLPDRVRLFARERENVAQEGFDAPVHRISPPHRLSA
jgi:hypothetical protein